MLGYIWGYLYTSFFRFWLKWLLRQLTQKCELQRICGVCGPGSTRTSRTEYSLSASKSQVLRCAVNVQPEEVQDCVLAIMKEKNIASHKDPMFRMNLEVCLLQITGYRKLFDSVEELRKQAFDCDDKRHEDMLLKLWDLLVPSVKLESRITKQWGDIGFQGDDPKTDFRGMGMLGLTNLLFFSEKYTELSRQVLSHSNHPKLGYSYAIVGINLTEMAYSLLRSGALKPHFYNSVAGAPHIRHFHLFYCYLAFEFDKFWIAEEPESIMEFNLYREKFHDKVKKLLREPDASLTLNTKP